VHAITITGPLDAELADALRARVREMIARGYTRLIFDASRIGSAAEERRRLRKVLDARGGACRIVAVLPADLAARLRLPVGIAPAASFGEARRLLATDRIAPVRRLAQVPDGALPEPDRHQLVLRQSMRCADAAAAEGDYERALTWLATVEAVGGALPAGWDRRREKWAHRHSA
jgi:hypothetical protein